MEHISNIIKRLQQQDFQTSERIDKKETEIEKAYKKYRSETTTNDILTLEEFRINYCKQ